MTLALQTTAQKLHDKTHSPTDIVVFTDSKSALEAITSSAEQGSKELFTLIHIMHHIMTYFNNIITQQWIPGHIGIEGNEKADKLSKAGSTMEQLERPTTTP